MHLVITCANVDLLRSLLLVTDDQDVVVAGNLSFTYALVERLAAVLDVHEQTTGVAVCSLLATS